VIGPIELRGGGFDRPEYVRCTGSGDVYASDRLAGIAHLAPDDRLRRIADPRAIADHGVLANGFLIQADGSFLVASMADEGGVFRIGTDGSVAPFLREVDGARLGATNFVLADAQGRLWITVSTRRVPRETAFNRTTCDGYIVLVDVRGARIVADGLSFLNEIRIDAAGRYLYANETYAQRVSRFPLAPDGSLGERETFSSLPRGSFVDGMAFDDDGHLWVTTLVRSGLHRLAPDGSAQTLFERYDEARLRATLAIYDAGGTLAREHVVPPGDDPLQSITSIAFGGADRRTVVLGSLGGTRLATFRR
jgi:sugar lactone lactonase YvrE